MSVIRRKATEEELKLVPDMFDKTDIWVVKIDKDKIPLFQYVIDQVNSGATTINTFRVDGKLVWPFALIGDNIITKIKEE